MPSQIAHVVIGTIVAAVVISTIVRIVNGEGFKSAMKPRRGQQSAIGVVCVGLAALFVWEQPDFLTCALAALVGIMTAYTIVGEVTARTANPSAEDPDRPHSSD